MEKFAQLDDTYVMKGKIGSGTGGIVYRAYHKRLQKDVVLKQIKGNMVHLDVRAETDILKRLKHPNLPQVLDFFEYDGVVFTVMEFIEGKSLQQYINEGVIFRQKPVVKWMLQLTGALTALHGLRPPIVHGDIKPANIMLTPEGDVCLIDFNISGAVTGDDAKLMGYTNSFASPEQIAACDAQERNLRINVSVDGRSDLYSLGATVCYLLTGKKTCARENAKELLEEVSPALSDALIRIILKLISYKKEDRYKNADSLKRALMGIKKADYRYKSLIVRQTIGLLVLAAMTVFFSVTAVYGHFRMQKEKEEHYMALVDELSYSWEEENYENAEELFVKATKLYPGRYEAYLQKARWLYGQGEYKKDISFIKNQALNQVELGPDSGDFYYILANCYFESDNYEAAVEAYGEAVSLKGDNSLYYSDYAIALARLGRADYAKKRLDKAVELGLTNDKTFYARGEINFAGGRYEEALEDFLTCVHDTKDENLKRRSYLMAAEIYLRSPDEEACLRCINLMTEAKIQLPGESIAGILEYLAKANMSMAAVTRDARYDDEALLVFKEIIDRGWGNYITHLNIAVLHQKRGAYDLAIQELRWMLSQYGEDYKIYMKMALVEISVQEHQVNSTRNYSNFKTYYDKALNLYENRKNTGETDSEMQILNNFYIQVKNGGWLQ